MMNETWYDRYERYTRTETTEGNDDMALGKKARKTVAERVLGAAGAAPAVAYAPKPLEDLGSREALLGAWADDALEHARRLRVIRDAAVELFRADRDVCYTGFSQFMKACGLAWDLGPGESRAAVPAEQPPVAAAYALPAGITFPMLRDEGVRAAVGHAREAQAAQVAKIRAAVIENRSALPEGVLDAVFAVAGIEAPRRAWVVSVSASGSFAFAGKPDQAALAEAVMAAVRAAVPGEVRVTAGRERFGADVSVTETLS